MSGHEDTLNTIKSHTSQDAAEQKLREELQREREICLGLARCEQGRAFLEHIDKKYLNEACFRPTERETNYVLGRRDFVALILNSAEYRS